MTQNWASPPQPNWNRGTRAWGQPTPGYGGAPQPYPPGQAPQPQYQAPRAPGYYGPPGSPAPPGQFPPRPPRKKATGRTILAVGVVVGNAILGIALAQLPDTDEHEVAVETVMTPKPPQTAKPTQSARPTPQPTKSTQSTKPTQPTTRPTVRSVPKPATRPPALPYPRTWSEAANWLERNPVYRQTAPVPTSCRIPKISIVGASNSKISKHANELTACLWRVWSGPLERAGYQLPRPAVKVYDRPIVTACGKVSEYNAYYCSADQRIYYGRSWWRLFPTHLQRSRFVVEAVIAHEFGHAVQARTGILASSSVWRNRTAQKSKSASLAYSRRLELQADCLAGIFVRAVKDSAKLSKADLAKLNQVQYALGDDVVARKKVGDHGQGHTRRTWFTTGRKTSLIGKCNAYTAPARSVR